MSARSYVRGRGAGPVPARLFIDPRTRLSDRPHTRLPHNCHSAMCPLAPAHVVVPQPLACCVHTENAWELGGEQGLVRKLSPRTFQLRTKITKLRKPRLRKKLRNFARERARPMAP